MTTWIKQKWLWILVAIVLISLDIWHKELFFSLLLAYGLAIKFLLSDSLSAKLRKIFAVSIWSTLVVLVGLTVYVNYGMPHGPSYPTGDIVCQNDDRGPCGEEYKEDLRNVDIPNWAKFLRKSEGELLLFGLLFAGIVVSGVKNKNQEE
ncbi:hypothetical protein COX95_02580 [bacterium CG_4_10_14_0_2_um_filter_33_32]|nr:MAG: hypothetical protein AUJ93_03010 [bacterium CG2_30_33_46]PIR67277.1 MAG: hypothetical protein COU50_04100 [bacterium CG10_big_fil_rev_8_21_14_0_10_33_18]PIU76577.1 MAG: hypothetical protein COS74_03305 [bacterium CG06_land_8_20_14_3_00_33_50]PIY85243.1 MAG: hypothetical protein COY76_03180 [bacterium CG_4_10_14_0_8_um_filter_33_57]PIZ85950.1 MAG: hypothetical protein COX95_02580 [bacterium CG_4_10_14_0_2_um_filter_33_32]PJA72670.1 MAG: hypothetical protein CO152_00210 [bacterium CG_4_9